MKKLVIALFILAIFAAPVFAQAVTAENESEFYYVTVQLEKIYPTRYGYILNYRRGIGNLATITLPDQWFTFAGSKAELVTLPSGTNWPYLTIYYKNGEFSHARLYVHPWKGHSTWGNIPLSVDVSGLFDPDQDLRIQY
jgi:hypothetical protein